ncbi:hypothetical protein GH714_036124 [Hevea brasiliensis]|uniref:Nucleosome assembly protein n=1 Tax=Hevea brasiliensis TaxID=3981 RepID=A0A6A6NEJ8_HEVBR|nr:hypothetical protein GH714_036124 [Hevea brasiliensis]
MSNDNKDTFGMFDVDASVPAAAAALSAEDLADLVNALMASNWGNLCLSKAGGSSQKNSVHCVKVGRMLKMGFFESLINLKAWLDNTNILETLSPIVGKRIEFLREIQRYEIVNGIKDVEGITNEVAKNQEGDKAIEEKGVPDFWLTAMKTNEVITDRDEGALKFLKDIKWCRIDNPEGFKLEFYFNTNPYFKNSVLTKTYHMIDDDDPILEKTIATEIEWYPGKCLTKKVLKKKRKKESKNAKPITKIKNCASFFNFFNTPNIPQEDDDPDGDAVEEIQDRMEQDYNVGTTIRDRVIPHAVSWFTGEAVDDELDVEDDNDNDNDNNDDDNNDIDEDKDEDDNEDDEDEDDDEGKRSRKKKSRGARAGKSQQSERASECKQQ